MFFPGTAYLTGPSILEADVSKELEWNYGSASEVASIRT